MKTWHYILIIYVLIALYIMYTRQQTCAMTSCITANGSKCCDTWTDIVLPGLTLGLYKKAAPGMPPPPAGTKPSNMGTGKNG